MADQAEYAVDLNDNLVYLKKKAVVAIRLRNEPNRNISFLSCQAELEEKLKVGSHCNSNTEGPMVNQANLQSLLNCSSNILDYWEAAGAMK